MIEVKSKDDEIALLSYSEAAKRMRIGRNTLRAFIDNGHLGIIRVGNRFKIPVREILKFIDENTVRIEQPTLPIQNPNTYSTIKSTDEIFYDVFEEVIGKVHPGRLRQRRKAEEEN
jgi:excisionase family DNA binding protein